jgi:hypothetical protein
LPPANNSAIHNTLRNTPAVFHALFNNITVLYATRHLLLHPVHGPMLWAHTLQHVVYLAASLLQLAYTSTAPQSYTRHRHAISAANRLVRLGLVALQAATSSPASWALLAGNSVSNSSSTSAASPGCSTAIQLARQLLAVPVVAWAPANWLLPFRWMLPVQLATVALHMYTSRSQVCWLQQQAAVEVRALLLPTCRGLQRLYTFAAQLLGASTAGRSGTCDDPITAHLAVVLNLHVLLLLLAPCFAFSHVEFVLKDRFLRARYSARLEQRLPAALPSAEVLLLVIVVIWPVCVVIVSALPPLGCTADGLLVPLNSSVHMHQAGVMLAQPGRQLLNGSFCSFSGAAGGCSSTTAAEAAAAAATAVEAAQVAACGDVRHCCWLAVAAVIGMPMVIISAYSWIARICLC